MTGKCYGSSSFFVPAQKECPIVCPDGRSLCDYNGTTAVTNGGRTCQKWTDQSPHSHYPGLLYGNQTLEDAENYCRSFEHEGKNYGNEPWCLTTDPEHRRQGCGETICGGRFTTLNQHFFAAF